MSTPVDLLVIGAGASGLVAAKTAAGLGARVTLVDRGVPGGDCLWTGCVPSKALLAAARRAHDVRDGARFGIVAGAPVVDFPRVMSHVRSAIQALEPPDSPAALAEAGVRVLTGEVVFAAPDTVTVDGTPVTFRRAVVATGAGPWLPPVPGLAAADPLTTETVWDLDRCPESMLVLGAGAVGCELGQAFARLGSRIVLVESAPRILPAETDAASGRLRASLLADGVAVHASTTVTGVYPDSRGWRVELAGPHGGPTSVRVERLLVAAGRRPDTWGLCAERAGVVRTDSGHVRVDRRLRTTNPRVFAAGDVTGEPALTHVAGTQGSIAATNALLGPLRSLDVERVPRVTFTDPEIAAVGATVEAARRRCGRGVRTRHVAHDDLDRAVTEAATDGFTEVVLDRRGRVVGACVVAPRAGEMLAELTALVARRGRLRDLAGVVHPYPAWTDAPWRAALAEVSAATHRPAARRALHGLVALRRRLDTLRGTPSVAAEEG